MKYEIYKCKMLDEKIALRDLIIYVDIEKQEVVYTNFEDEIDFRNKIRDRNYSRRKT